jgi:hypothetical protein
MKKVTPLVLSVVFAIFAQQQQDTIPLPAADSTSILQTPLQDTIPLPATDSASILQTPLQDTIPLPATDSTSILQTPLQDSIPLPATDSTSILQTPLQDSIPQPATDSTNILQTPLQDSIPQPATDSTNILQTPLRDTMPPHPPEPSMPRNTITIDFGPTIIGVAIGIAGDKLLDEKTKISALGFAAQYELQFSRHLSLALRFAYMGFKTGVVEEQEIQEVLDGNNPELPNAELPGELPGGLPNTDIVVTGKLKAELKAALTIYSIEAHPRLYPFGGSFFLEGMVGYANLKSDFSGDVIVNVEVDMPDLPIYPDSDELPPKSIQKEAAKLKASRNYLKYGGKFGWRVDFGEPGGFIFEHALGFYGASGFGETIVKKLSDSFENKADIGKFDDAFSMLEKFVFVGGPRYTFAFGWRF